VSCKWPLGAFWRPWVILGVHGPINVRTATAAAGGTLPTRAVTMAAKLRRRPLMPIERGRGAPAATGSWMLPPPEGQAPGRIPVLRELWSIGTG